MGKATIIRSEWNERILDTRAGLAKQFEIVCCTSGAPNSPGCSLVRPQELVQLSVEGAISTRLRPALFAE
jgi:hypothetical protein